MNVICRFLLLIILLCPISITACTSKEYSTVETYQETVYTAETITESYTENETPARTECGESNLISYFNWSAYNLSFAQMPYIHYYGYDIPAAASYDNIRLRVSLWPQLQTEAAKISVFDMSRTGQIQSPEPLIEGAEQGELPKGSLITGQASIHWLKSANSIINQAKFLGGGGFLWSKKGDPAVFYLNAGKASSIAVIVSGLGNTWNGRFNIDAVWECTNSGHQTVTKQRQVTRQVPVQVERQRTVSKVKYVPFWETLFP